MPDINSDIQYLKGALARLTPKVGEARHLHHPWASVCRTHPRRYIDYSQPYTVVSAPFDVDCCVKATVLQRDPDRRIKGGRMLSHVLAGDDTGMLALSWFNAPYAAEKLEPGTEYCFAGRVGGMMTSAGKSCTPLVPAPKPRLLRGASCRRFTETPKRLPAARLTRCAQLALEYVAQLDDPLPPELLTRYRMPPKADAVRAIHARVDAADAKLPLRRRSGSLWEKNCISLAAGHIFDAGPRPQNYRCPRLRERRTASGLEAQPSALCTHRAAAPLGGRNLP
ncbi:MAG: hypothetical protein ACLT8A_11370 [Subdoligranulum sp.]